VDVVAAEGEEDYEGDEGGEAEEEGGGVLLHCLCVGLIQICTIDRGVLIQMCTIERVGLIQMCTIDGF
jgi:hypothetical protein